MTKEEWERAEETLKEFYPAVHLKADGYDVALRLVRIGTYKNAIMVYVNGVFDPKWLAEDCEERRRFCQEKTRSFLNAKQKSDYKRFPKRMQKELAEKYHGLEYKSYCPYWTSFGALKRHLIANNQSIELAKIG